MGYTKTVIKGVSWMTGIRIVTRGLAFGKTIIIARILNPAQFGIFGIATLVLSLVEILTETGINIFLVQQKAKIDDYVNTAWLVSIIRGFLISFVIAVSSPFVADFFNAPDATSLLLLMSIVPLVRGFINPSVINFLKELTFHKEFYYRSILIIVETLLSIFLVMLTHSIVSLVWALIVSAIVEVILSFCMVKPRPAFIFEKIKFLEVISYGKWITASGIFNYFYQHGDDIAVGRLLGTSSLGLYDMAYRISLAPLTDIADVITKVTLPVYVKISEDRKRLQKAFFKSLFLVIVLILPISMILFFFPKEIVTILLGDKWLGSVPALQVLALFGLIRAISVFSSTIFFSVQKQTIVTLTALIGLFGLGITIVPFIYLWGIVGAGLSALVGTILTLPIIFYNLYLLFINKK
jgi:lipopolysaccharide exporter